MIPGWNDSEAETNAMTRWIVAELGPDVPVHFTAFHPDYKMRDIPATPAATLRRARDIALAEGLNYVFTGNVHDETGGTTYCPSCRMALIVRDWYEIEEYRVTNEGKCPHCGTAIAGRYEAFKGQFGRRRIPVAIRTPV
jgi:pyruvate formate lyase activating enzyme